MWTLLKPRTGLQTILRALCILVGWLGAAQLLDARNVALHARYTYQPASNYAYTKSQDDMTKLTSGYFASGHFWTSRERTVGWYRSGPIRIEVDLASVSLIDSICANSARGKVAAVSFPERVDLFVSLDRRSYTYIGDAMEDKEHDDGGYIVRKFCANRLDVRARYVLLILQPRGDYTFLDQIEIFDGNGEPGKSPRLGYTLSREEIPSFQEALFYQAQYFKSIVHMAKSLQAAISNVAKTDDYFSRINADIALLIAQINNLHADNYKTGGPDDRLDELLALSRKVLTRRFNESLVVWHTNPWRPFTPIDIPDNASRIQDVPLVIDLMRGGTASDVVVLTNNTNQTQEYRLKTRVQAVRGSAPVIELREVVPVLLVDGTVRGDPLVKLKNDSISIGPGESKEVWLSVVAQNSAAAEYSSEIEVDSINRPKSRIVVPLKLKVWSVTLPASQRLNVITWSYLTWPAIRNMQEPAVADLFAHHVNVFVLNESEVPWPYVTDRTRPDRTPDYTKFDRFVRLHKGARKLLFYLDFESQAKRSFGDRLRFLSAGWQEVFREWISRWAQHAIDLGLGYDDFAFYPVDEPQGGEQADYLLETARLIKEIDPRLEVYTTLGRLPDMDLLKAVRVVDVFQVPTSELSSTKVSLLRALGKEVWCYAAGGKQADPLVFYRGQAWRAFQEGAKGIGFWSYADTGGQGTAWNDLDGTRPDYAVIYEGQSGPVSSKRWEAWREGVEDYELLNLARKRITGTDEATEFYSEIGEATVADYERFRRIRRHMLSIAAD